MAVVAGASLGRLRALLPQGRVLPDEVWRSRHRAILVLLWANAVFVPIFGIIRGYDPAHIALESLVVPTAGIFASSRLLDQRARTAAASLGLLSASAVLVHLSGGLIEMHFHFFVMVSVVALYQDWLPFLTAIAYVVIHHGLMGSLDPESVYNHTSAFEHPWRWAAVHGGFITGSSIACLVTWRLNERILVHNEALYESERRARVASEVAQSGLSLLADATQVLTSSLEVDVILHDLAQLVVRSAADVCFVDLVSEDGSLRRISAVARGQDAAGRATEPPDRGELDHPVMRCIRTGRSALLDPVPPALLQPRGTDPSTAEHSSAIVAPLVGRAETLGVLTFVCLSKSRRLGDAERHLAEELGQRAGIAIQNARLYARQRTVAETLQHSLLPEQLPEVAGIETAARYVAGGPGVEIGGDWYDVVRLSGGRLLLVMGDVVGRGERAAALMGQVRNALRAYALFDMSPTAVVTNVNRLLHDLDESHMATMVCALLDPETGELRIANAGHPAPALLSADGTVRFLDHVSGPPVGAVARTNYREEVCTLEPGTTVLLYTDGLVEDRETTLDSGMSVLADALRSAPQEVGALVDHVLQHGTAGRSAGDDVAVLAVRLIALDDHLHLELPTTVASLESLRATLRRWLVRAGATEEESFEIVVAACEACANVIVHARGPRQKRFEFDARRDGDIRIDVRDHGTWRPPRNDNGGRGLQIIQSFMDEVHVETGPDGTHVTMRRRLSASAKSPT